MTSEVVYDVAILSDFRYPGGTSASIAEEVRAQAAAGLTTILLQTPSPFLTNRGFNPRIVDCLRAGHADLAVKGQRVAARVLTIRQPRIFVSDLEEVPKVAADTVVMVVNQGPRDLDDGSEYYDLAEVQARVHRYFGAARWYAIGPSIRRQVEAVDPSFVLESTYWHNVINVDEWWMDRPEPVGKVPVIGRHSRAESIKWPKTAQEIRDAYPVTDDFKVRVLGGGEFAAKRLGAVPASWEILRFGSVDAKDFLRSVDYFVYFHDPSLVEAFGRAILEAMASGVPVVVPHHFRELFEDAALYRTTAEVQDTIRSLHRDRAKYREIVENARAYVEKHFGYASHAGRLKSLGVEAAKAPTAESTRSAADVNAPTVMMLSSNGAGLGHLTRLMSIARRLPQDLRTVIATQSYAASVVEDQGYFTEYIPSVKYLGIAAARWNEFLHDRLQHLIATHRPALVAVDGTVPYNGLLSTSAVHPEITWVWVRRAMWKKGAGQRWIERSTAFDFVLEPGEFGAEADEGPTVAERERVVRVDPIVYLDDDELLTADQARQALGLDKRPAALLQLGAGNINDISSPIARISRSLADRGYQVVLAQSPIATTP
ncbi:MAG: glycosyltransferase family 4 protein, partial [Kribbellaceae bacterium]|nr:glycosyltransferase family 4 protein [Kribbellaceae bacterium]